ncbi:MAG: hypothetical protein R3337_07950 [Gammaproteobacteria bacterium]|nr:hypothetical protein [Gammaproteobacteria bacterium]
MHAIHFNVTGNIVAALFFFSLPLIIVLAGALARGKGIDDRRWQFARRHLYLPLLAPLLLYYGVIYSWLFYDQFYWIEIEKDGELRLEYYLPSRTITISSKDISHIESFSGDLWTHKAVRIFIVMTDGTRHRSAQVSRWDENLYLTLLNRLGA